jgi:four helix bundle protein
MQDFKELKVWEKGHQLTLTVYRITKDFPKSELYGLVSQMRRAAGSVPSNIAEGCGRSGQRELARFLEIAVGSASELQYHFILARDLEYLQSQHADALEQQAIEVKRMLASLIGRVRNSGSALTSDN